MKEAFWKMTGSGNDFVMLDGRSTDRSAWPADRIAAVCDRRLGVGADGLVILTPEAPGTVRLDYFNADGGEAALCGNATLCGTRLSARLGLAPADGMRLVTGAGVLETRCTAGEDGAELHLPDFQAPVPPVGMEPQPGEAWIRFGTAGVPHLVVRVGDVSEVDVIGRGGALRRDPSVGAAGANANFVSPPDPADPANPTDAGLGRWRIRTFERGVEGETLACGTGTVAAAVALLAAGEARSPVEFTSSGGFPLTVRARLDGALATDVWLGGQGRLVFEGRLAD